MRSSPTLEAFWRDARLGVRSLAKAKTMSATVIITLALGIGATSAIFSVVNGVLLKPLGYPDADRLIALVHAAPGLDSEDKPSAPFLYFTYKEQSEAFEAIGLWARWPSAITGLEQPEEVPSILVTSEMLSLLGVKPLLGRTFSSQDGQPDAPRTIVLSYAYWQRRFGGAPSAIGQRLMVDAQPWEIIGVMPSKFRFLDEEAAIFRPLPLNRANTRLGFDSFQGIARLKPGVTMGQAAADIRRMIPIAINSFPPPIWGSREQFRQFRLTPRLRSLKTQVVGDVSGTLWILMGTVSLVLLIACANVANLFLVRTEGRQRELGIRAALGAGRPQIARELLIESLLLAGAGGVLGLGLAYGGLQWMLSRGPANLPRMADVYIDPTVLAFTAGISLLTGLLFGIIPMLRFGGPQLSLTLHGVGRNMTQNKDAQRTRGMLVIVQVALALVLMVGSGLMLRTFQALNNIDPGFREPDHVQTIRFNIPEKQAPDPEVTTRTMNQIIEHLAAIPGVQAAAFGSEAPLEKYFVGAALFVEGVQYAKNQGPPLRVKFISPDFFASLGTSLLAGRDLEWADYYDRRPVALVSASLARKLWDSPTAALGKRIRSSDADPWREIVGVAGDVVANELHDSPSTAYFPTLMDNFWGRKVLVWRQVTLTIRTPRAGTEEFMREVQSAIWSVNPNLVLGDVRTLGGLYRQSLQKTSFVLALLSVAGVMALLLGIVGIYGVVSYAVSQRTREIGIRVALGASSGGVRRFFTRQAVGLVATGTAIGLAAAFGLTRVMASLLFGVKPIDPATFLLAPALLVGIGSLASYFPALRALRVDPVEVLREQ